MKQATIVGGKLALICALAAVSLGVANEITAPVIAELKAKQLKEALQMVVPSGEAGEETFVEDHPVVTAYYPITEGNSTTGYVIKLVGKGYAGDLVLLASFSLEGEILGSVLLDNEETPGLGKEAENPEYMKRFYIGTGGTSPVPAKKSELSQANADAVSGATITFIGIGQALSAGSEYTKKLGGAQ